MPREIICIGVHRSRALRADLTKSSKKDTPCVEVECQIVGGDDDGAVGIWQGWLTPAAMPFTVKALRCMGWQGDDLSELSTVGSKEFDITVGEEEYNDRVRSRIQFINELGSGGPATKPMTADEKKRFAAQMRGQVIAASGGKPSPRASTPAARPAAAPHPNAPGATPAPGYEPPPFDDEPPV